MAPKATIASNKTITSNGGRRKIDGIDESLLLSQAKQSVVAKTRGSSLLDVHAEERIPKFRMDGKRSLFESAKRP
jgi:hypothetical protein